MQALWQKCAGLRDTIRSDEAGESSPAYKCWRGWLSTWRGLNSNQATIPAVREYRMRLWDKGSPNGD